jgi:hypothetical protein
MVSFETKSGPRVPIMVIPVNQPSTNFSTDNGDGDIDVALSRSVNIVLAQRRQRQ